MVRVSSSSLPGIKKGDFIKTINGNKVNDFLDIYFYTSGMRTIKFDLVRDDKEIDLKIRLKTEGRSLPLIFENPKYQRCQNRCFFCFIDRLPPGLRKELYFKDDDYRLSFLYGNFITLTNITDNDLDRIRRLRLSPLYISVHSTNPELRARIFKNPSAAKIIPILEKLVESNITLHCQIVLIPGVNDGKELKMTIGDLYKLFPGVASIGIVPAGDTRYSKQPLPEITTDYAVRIIKQIHSMQNFYRKKIKKGFVYLADEFYLKGSISLPDYLSYDDFPQLENGIGMAASFLKQLESLKVRPHRGKFLFITGKLAAPLIKLLASKLGSGTVRVVENRFFGPKVTVSGLLTAQDIRKTINHKFDRIILPPNCVNEDGRFINNGKIEDFDQNRVIVAPASLEELVRCLT